MNLSELQRKLVNAARANPPGDQVPYAFEKRILARLEGTPAPADPWAVWEHGLKRAAFLCAGFTLLLSAGLYFLPASKPDTLSQDFEKTMFAAVDNAPGDFPGEAQ